MILKYINSGLSMQSRLSLLRQSLTYRQRQHRPNISSTSLVVSMLYEWHFGDLRIDQFLADVKFHSAAVRSVRSVHVTHGNVLLQRR